jgi:hypothetical protein
MPTALTQLHDTRGLKTCLSLPASMADLMMIGMAPNLPVLANAGGAVAARHFRPPNAASKPPPTAATIPAAKYNMVSSL